MENEGLPSFCGNKPSPEEFFASLDPCKIVDDYCLDIDYIVHGTSTLSVIDRLDIPKEYFTEDEIKMLENEARQHASSFQVKYQNKLKDVMNDFLKVPNQQEVNVSERKELIEKKRIDEESESGFGIAEKLNKGNISKLKQKDCSDVEDDSIGVLEYFRNDLGEVFEKVDEDNLQPKYSENDEPLTSDIVTETLKMYDNFFEEVDDGKYDEFLKTAFAIQASDDEDEEKEFSFENVQNKDLAKILMIPDDGTSVDLLDSILRDSEDYLQELRKKLEKPSKEVKFPFSDSEEEESRNIARKKMESKIRKKMNLSKRENLNTGRRDVWTQYEPQKSVNAANDTLDHSSNNSLPQTVNESCSLKKKLPESSVTKPSSNSLASKSFSSTVIQKKELSVHFSASEGSLRKKPPSSALKAKVKGKELKKTGNISDSSSGDDWEGKAVDLLANKKINMKKITKKNT